MLLMMRKIMVHEWLWLYNSTALWDSLYEKKPTTIRLYFYSLTSLIKRAEPDAYLKLNGNVFHSILFGIN